MQAFAQLVILTNYFANAFSFKDAAYNEVCFKVHNDNTLYTFVSTVIYNSSIP